MLALSSWPGLSMETRTSKFVTLSRSTPIGEICVTLPWKVRSLNVSTRMRAGWPSRRLPISVSSTRPRTNTCEMSPIVMTDVAAAPILRMDDTGLPISTSRARMRPRMGARMVALASSSSARSTDACVCATFAEASEIRAFAIESCDSAPRRRFSAWSSCVRASSSWWMAMSF